MDAHMYEFSRRRLIHQYNYISPLVQCDILIIVMSHGYTLLMSSCVRRRTTIETASPSWAEGDLVVAVPGAGMELLVVLREEVGLGAPGARAHDAVAGAAGEGHGEVVAVDHRDVVEVLGAAEGELGQRHGRLPGEGAGERAAAVAGRAPPAVAVEGAPRAAPDPAGAGAGGHAEGPRLARVELPAAADGGGRWPHRGAAVVGDGEGGEEKEEDRGGSH
uniref:Uncharacterized protein n=1 Tax=Setaria viridis TaxID=4556 RepID=A0A4U6VLQ8_SETVI|nr:hypothetical protein SEVIR_3G417800v2 [Setaria viridis]